MPASPLPSVYSKRNELVAEVGHGQAHKSSMRPEVTVPTMEASPASHSSPSLTARSTIPDSQSSSISAPADTLPPQLLSLHSSIRVTLEQCFLQAPPFTVQRLAELILYPTGHYRTLPSFLRAIDRVISVSSTTDEFPLPSLANDSLESGETSYLTAQALPRNQTDEFNGAALTRIPWLHKDGAIFMNSDRQLMSDLRTESTSFIDGPHGAGSIETVTVSVNGSPKLSRDLVSQSSHAQAAGKVAGLDQLPSKNSKSIVKDHRAEDLGEEVVHARGPAEIGIEDMGPQTAVHGKGQFDIEAAVGRPVQSESIAGDNNRYHGTVESVNQHISLGATNKTAGIEEPQTDVSQLKEEGAQ